MREQEETDNTDFHGAREALLHDLEAAGLFSEALYTTPAPRNDTRTDDAYVEQKERCLRRWGYATLETYHKAALAFLNHFRPKESQVVRGGADSALVLSISVSIDALSFPFIPESF